MADENRIVIDRSLCIGTGNCVFYAEKTFDLDDENTAIIIDPLGDDGAARRMAVTHRRSSRRPRCGSARSDRSSRASPARSAWVCSRSIRSSSRTIGTVWTRAAIAPKPPAARCSGHPQLFLADDPDETWSRMLLNATSPNAKAMLSSVGTCGTVGC